MPKNPESAIELGTVADPHRLIPNRRLKHPNNADEVLHKYFNDVGIETIMARRQRYYTLPVATGTIISGYLEGASAAVTIAGVNGPIGKEIVYNFATFERMEFKYGLIVAWNT